jgi:NAD(P)-dependent dehydrogenase (short-subunit alcohol dehydrogenase family)/acyl carrier protein
LATIEALGAEVHCVRADVSSEDDVRRLLDEIRRQRPPLRGMVHAAGVNDDALLADLDWERFETVLAPKLAGATHLDRLTRDLPLDFFVVCSSAAALSGRAGQANYAAANAFLDAWAAGRRHDGAPATSIAWGPWDRVGMTARLGERDLQAIGRLGYRPMRPDDGAAAFEQAIALCVPCVVAADLDRSSLPDRPLFSTLRPGTADARKPGSALLDEIGALPPAMRRRAVSAFVRGEATRILGLAADHDLAPRQPLSELGLDSLMAVELRNALGAALGTTLPATLLFDHPTADALVDYFMLPFDARDEPAVEEQVASATRVATLPSVDIAALSEEEAEALLLTELGDPEPAP